MARLYSTRFIQAPSVSGGPNLEYTVPTGYLAVVKCISIVHGIVTVTGYDAWVQTDDLTKLVRGTWFTTLGSPTNNGGTDLFWGQWVFVAGQSLYTQAGTGTVDIFASGYLLSVP